MDITTSPGRSLRRSQSPKLDKKLGAGLTTEALHDLARAGDQAAIVLFAAAGQRLGQAVAMLVNVLDPERMIIGGGVAQAGEFLLEPCRQTARGLILAEASRDVAVVPAELGPFAAALGVATMAAEREAGRC